MLSIVPLMAGGDVFETGAGRSAPKHVHQLVEKNHLRWGFARTKFLALGACFEDLGNKTDNKRATLLGKDARRRDRQAAGERQGPSRKIGEPDNRGSQFYLALYWAQAVAEQSEGRELDEHFTKLAKTLAENEQRIVADSLRSKAIRWISAATTTRTARRPQQ